jgi:hypothetical protein
MFRFQKEFLEKIVELGEEEGLDVVAGRKEEERLLRDIVMFVLWRRFNFEQVLIGEVFGVTGAAVSVRLISFKRKRKRYEERINEVCRRIAIGGYYGEGGCVSVGESVVAIMKSLVPADEDVKPCL